MDNGGFKNSIVQGVPWSADLEPVGPAYPDDGDADSGRVSQSEPYGYDGLPDIAVPKHRVSG
jgi:hypothetical protein